MQGRDLLQLHTYILQIHSPPDFFDGLASHEEVRTVFIHSPTKETFGIFKFDASFDQVGAQSHRLMFNPPSKHLNFAWAWQFPDMPPWLVLPLIKVARCHCATFRSPIIFLLL